MITEIAEKIEVGAIFRRGLTQPVWFIWKSRKYHVKSVTYQWHEMKGESLHYFFQIVADSGVFEVSLNSRTLGWSLEKAHDEEFQMAYSA